VDSVFDLPRAAVRGSLTGTHIPEVKADVLELEGKLRGDVLV
jgi:hypothetical protein